jgi:hypothetical protein
MVRNECDEQDIYRLHSQELGVCSPYNQLITMTVWTFNRIPTHDEASDSFIRKIEEDKRRTHAGAGRYGKQYYLKLPSHRRERDAAEKACRMVEQRMKDTDDAARIAVVDNDLRYRERKRDDHRDYLEKELRATRKAQRDIDKESSGDEKHRMKQAKMARRLRAKGMRREVSPSPSSSSYSEEVSSDDASEDDLHPRKRTSGKRRGVHFSDQEEPRRVPVPEGKDGLRTENDNIRINEALAYLAQFGITGMERPGYLLPPTGEVRTRLTTFPSAIAYGRSPQGQAPELRGYHRTSQQYPAYC